MRRDLFGEYPDRPGHVRGSDTSTQAADSLKDTDLTRLRRQIFEFIEARDKWGATCDEVEVALNLIHQTASARIRELVMFGRIEDSGRRRRTRRNRNAVVYILAS